MLSFQHKAHMAKPTKLKQIFFFFVVPLSCTALLIEQYVLILSVGACVHILVNTSCMYILHISNVPTFINELMD